jgi:hypothetical protein
MTEDDTEKVEVVDETITDSQRWKHERENGLMSPDMAAMYDAAKAQIEHLTFDRDYAQECHDVALQAANKAHGYPENWQTFSLHELVVSLETSLEIHRQRTAELEAENKKLLALIDSIKRGAQWADINISIRRFPAWVLAAIEKATAQRS